MEIYMVHFLHNHILINRMFKLDVSLLYGLLDFRAIGYFVKTEIYSILIQQHLLELRERLSAIYLILLYFTCSIYTSSKLNPPGLRVNYRHL